MRIASWCLIVASGCTTIDDGFGLEIDARDAPVVVVKDGDGPWERVATTPDGLAYVQIHDSAYGVGALCSDDSSKSATFLFDTRPQTVFLQCPVWIPASDAVHVRGTTEPLATVWVDSRSVRADAAGHYDLTIYQPGLHDVVALLATQPPKIVAHRAIVIAGETVVDLPAADAVEMTSIYPTVLGTKPEELQLSSDLNTGTDWIPFESDHSIVYVPPSNFLLTTDHPAVIAQAGGCTRQHPLSAANEPFELPAPLEYTLDRSQITWIADANVAWDSALLDIYSYGGPESIVGSQYRAFSSASWREATGTAAIPIVDLAALPGWSGGLAKIRPDAPADVNFYMSRGARDGDFTSCGANEQIDRW